MLGTITKTLSEIIRTTLLERGEEEYDLQVFAVMKQKKQLEHYQRPVQSIRLFRMRVTYDLSG